MLKPIMLIAAAGLLVAAAAPPRYDIYDYEDNQSVSVAAGSTLTIRLWTDFADSEWRLIPQTNVVLQKSSRFRLPPDPNGGVGFSSGDDITVKIAKPGSYRLVFQYTKKATGKQDSIYSNQAFNIIAR